MNFNQISYFKTSAGKSVTVDEWATVHHPRLTKPNADMTSSQTEHQFKLGHIVNFCLAAALVVGAYYIIKEIAINSESKDQKIQI